MKASLVKTHPTIAAQWNQEKNGELKPGDVTYGSGNKVWWVCEKGHEWEAKINNRSNGRGCPYCSGKKVCNDNCLMTVNPSLAEEWHPSKNTISPHEVTCNVGIKVYWLCGKHHEWEATVDSRTKGNGCPYCANKKACHDNCLATLRPDIATEWHPSKNPCSPMEVMCGTFKHVWWVCTQGHTYKSRIDHRTNGSGCPECSLSKGEEAVKQVLKSLNVKYKREFPLKKKDGRSLRFDFAVVVGHKRGLIEYHGIQHYESVDHFGGKAALLKRQQVDHIKRTVCQRPGLSLLEIPFWDFEKVEELVTEFVRSLE